MSLGKSGRKGGAFLSLSDCGKSATIICKRRPSRPSVQNPAIPAHSEHSSLPQAPSKAVPSPKSSFLQAQATIDQVVRSSQAVDDTLFHHSHHAPTRIDNRRRRRHPFRQVPVGGALVPGKDLEPRRVGTGHVQIDHAELREGLLVVERFQFAVFEARQDRDRRTLSHLGVDAVGCEAETETAVGVGAGSVDFADRRRERVQVRGDWLQCGFG